MSLREWRNAALDAGKFVHPSVNDYINWHSVGRFTPALNTAQRRGLAYYRQCLAAGFEFTNPYDLRGATAAARALGTSRQALTAPLKEYLLATSPEHRPRASKKQAKSK
ncbi:MAG: hypothetical protein R3F09_08955 [Burkholderiaceae bacterium]